jgi:hypothetical protein
MKRAYIRTDHVRPTGMQRGLAPLPSVMWERMPKAFPCNITWLARTPNLYHSHHFETVTNHTPQYSNLKQNQPQSYLTSPTTYPSRLMIHKRDRPRSASRLGFPEIRQGHERRPDRASSPRQVSGRP